MVVWTFIDIGRTERESGSIIGFHENGDHKRCSHVELTGLTGTEEIGTRFVPLEFDK